MNVSCHPEVTNWFPNFLYFSISILNSCDNLQRLLQLFSIYAWNFFLSSSIANYQLMIIHDHHWTDLRSPRRADPQSSLGRSAITWFKFRPWRRMSLLLWSPLLNHNIDTTLLLAGEHICLPSNSFIIIDDQLLFICESRSHVQLCLKSTRVVHVGSDELTSCCESDPRC